MANTANTTVLTTDFNVSPYYDDYDPSRGYYRILFKPGYAVQSRELTQLQTSLQEQIKRFGQNIFKDGTIVIPGAFNLETNSGLPAGRGISYVKIMDTDASNNSVIIADWDNWINQGKQYGNTRLSLVGNTSNITAEVIQVLDGVQTSQNTKTFYISYTSSSSANASIKAFQKGERLTANVNGVNKTLIVHRTDANTTGKGSRFSISSGVLFAKGHFVAFPEQAVIIDRYNPNPTAKVGFYITEDIVSASQDSSLLDPALQSSNFTAPGADRLQLNPILDVVPIDASTSVQDFVTLFTMRNGLVTQYNANTQYAYINDEMARRTFDNSGDYVVSGLGVSLKEHENNGKNYGRFTVDQGGNNSLLNVGVSPGKAYIQGYLATALSTVDLSTPKGLTSKPVASQLTVANMGQYVTVNEFVGGWQHNKGIDISFYDTAQQRITGRKWSPAGQSGTLIGTAKLLSVEYVSGTPGYDAKYNVYLTNIAMLGTHSFAEVRSLYAAAVGSYNSNLGADVVTDPITGKAVLKNIPNSTLLYYTGSNSTKTIRDSVDPLLTRTKFEFRDSVGIDSAVQVSTNGRFTIAISPGSEQFPFGTSASLTTPELEQIFVTFNKTSTSQTFMASTLPGSSSTGAGTTTLTGIGTKFTRLNVGDKVQLSGNNSIYYIKNITSDTSMVVDANLPVSVTGNTIYKYYESGDQINLFGVGSTAGQSRTVSATPTTLQFNLQELFPSIFYATVSYPVQRTSALEIKKTLRASRFVKIDCSSNAGGLTGPYVLGFADVYKIKSIRVKDGSFPTSITDGSDAKSLFNLDNGQTDTQYLLGKIIPKIPMSTSTRILVELDYFLPDFTNRAGYFSIDSYPIQDNDALFDATQNIRTEQIPVFKSPNTGQSYDLRNYFDFRPIKINSAADATTPLAATINPLGSTSYNYPAAGMKFPIPSSQIEYDYYYYLGRTDLVVVDKDNRFQVIQGQASANPQIPQVVPGSMTLAQLNISPYPSLAPSYAASIGRPELASTAKSLEVFRYTMSDIGKLKQRIVNLEYYTALSLLEMAASSLTITNDQGLNRFKNGIFTDSFRDNSLAATYDPQFRIVFDPAEKSIRPVYKMESIVYDFDSGTNVKFNNPLITVDYTEVLHDEQHFVTTDINVERQSWLFLGQVDLFPAQDIWIDTTLMPDEKLTTQGTTIVTYGSQGTSNEAITAYGTDQHVILSGNTEYGVYEYDGTFNPNTTGGVVDVLNTTEWNSWKSLVVGYKVYTGRVNSDGSPTSVQFTTYDAAKNYASSINTAGGAGVTIETVYNTTRTGTQYWEADSTSTVTTGYKVIDVQNYAYIRPQKIAVHCTGMKPYTQMWPYFDNIPMANVSRPLTANQFSWILGNGQFGLPSNTLINLQTGTSTNTAANILPLPSTLGPWSNNGDPLITDANGRLDFQMTLASGQFKVGDRNCLVIDSRQYVDSTTITSAATVPADVSTGGQGVFTASGQAVTKQRTILSTGTVSYHTESISQSFNQADFQYIAAPPPPSRCSHSCSAYSFMAKATNGEEGMFLTSIDLFVSRIGPEGFWVEIREMDSGQQITRNTVPFSEVFFNDSSKVPISPNGKDNPCHIVFPSPVFLYNNTQYAFVIHPINANPNLYVWISRLGQTDINGYGPVNSRRGTGTFYQTNNNTNWDIVPDIDLALKLYRAEFNKNPAQAVLRNRPIEKLYIRNASINFTGEIGQIFISGDHLKLSSPTLNTGATVALNDFVVGTLSHQNSAAVNVMSGVVAAGNTGYYKGEGISFYSSNGTYKGSGVVNDITNARGTLSYYIDGDTSLVHLSGSGGGFVLGDAVICSSDWSQRGYLKSIYSINNFRYSAFSFEPSALNFQLTSMSYELRPVSTSGAIGSYVSIDPSTTHYFNTEQAVLSRTNEINQLGTAYSQLISVNMQTASNVVSPVLDTSKTQSVIIDNIINNDITNETTPTHGALINKYISKLVTLDEGQDAEDMRVILSAYRPPGTDVKVWAKILNADDPISFENQNWVELYKSGNGDQTYSSLDDRNNFKEYTYLIPKSSVDRLTLTGGTAPHVNVGYTLTGLTSAFSATIDRIEKNTIYVMTDSGFMAGETVNVIDGSGTVTGTKLVSATGRTVAMNGTVGGTSNVISYTTDAGVTYTMYKYFAIKIGLLNDGVNSAIVPRVGDLRVLALQL